MKPQKTKRKHRSLPNILLDKENRMAEEKETRESICSQSQISRREFLKDAGLIVGGATVGSMALMNACKGDTVTETVTKTSTVTSPGGTTTSTVTVTSPPTTKIVEVSVSAPTINLTVNGEVYNVVVEPQETLHEVVRNKIGFLSLKEMCTGYGACGSCSLIMDGRPVLSCMVLAAECDGRVLETAEGIAKSKPDLVEAYIVNHCMQCGYCTPGFIVTAKALLDHKPHPTDEEIKEALGGNICRCATYPQHVLAVKAVS